MDSSKLSQFAFNMLAKNPQVSQNPQAQSMINVIKNGDNEKGKQIAQNLCDTYGVTPEQAINQAMAYFKIPKIFLN